MAKLEKIEEDNTYSSPKLEKIEPSYGIPGETPPAVNVERSPVDELFRKVGIGARGATAPAVGAMIGSRFGPVGTLIGAGTMAAADLFTLGLDAAGMDVQKYPSDYVKDFMGFPTPETTTEKVIEAGFEGLAGVRPSANAFKQLAETSTGVPQKIFDFLSVAPKSQAAASGTGAGTSQYVLDTTGDPVKAMGAGLASSLPFGFTAGRGNYFSGSNVLKNQSSNMYKFATDQGVTFKKPAFISLYNDVESKVKPLIGSLVEKNDKGINRLDPKIGSAEVVTGTPKTLRYLNEFKILTEKNVTLDDLQTLRTNINRSIMKSSDEEANALRKLRDGIDNFVDKADENALAAFKGPTNKAAEAKNALNKAKDLWRRGSRAELLEEINQTALIRSGRSRKEVNDLMLDKLETLRKRNDYNKMFSPLEREAIDKVLKGGDVSSFLRGLEDQMGITATMMASGTTPVIYNQLPENIQAYAGLIPFIPKVLQSAAGKTAGLLEQRQLSALEDMIRKGGRLSLTEQVGANLINPALIAGRSTTGSLGGMACLLGI